ncbi:hypothetical protein [Kitasatospora sp. NPDC004531]
MDEQSWDDDRAYAAAVEHGERTARFGLAVSAGVAALLVGFVVLAILLGLALLVGGAYLFVHR